MKKVLIRWTLSFSIGWQLLVLEQGYPQKTMTATDFIRLKYPLKYLTCAPNGTKLAFTMKEADLKTGRYHYSLWQLHTESAQSKPMVTQLKTAINPQWSPNSQIPLIAFLARPESAQDSLVSTSSQNMQLFIVHQDSTQPQKLSDMAFGVNNFIWSPDGSSLIYWAKELPDSSDYAVYQQKQQQKKDAYRFEQPRFKTGIWIFDLSSSYGTRIIKGGPGIEQLAISPDGELVVFCTNYTGLPHADNYDLWLLSLGTGQTFQLTTASGAEFSPQFSPDGQQIAYLSNGPRVKGNFQSDILVIPTVGGLSRNLTIDFDQNITAFQWKRSGAGLMFTANVRTEQRIFTLDPANKKIEPFGEAKERMYFNELHPAPETAHWFAWGETETTLPELFHFNEKSPPKQLTHFSHQLDSFQLAPAEIFKWSGPDGEALEALLIRPQPFQREKTYPLVVILHGGPYGAIQSRLIKNDYLQIYAQHGYLVFAPNFAGSVGYGEAFARDIQKNIGRKDGLQVLAGIEQLIEKEAVDPTRLYLIGASYGGYLVNWLISQTSRFRAAVSQFGIFNLASDWSSSSKPDWQEIYLGSFYWENPALYQQLSPSSYVQQINTPLLLLHGKDDPVTHLNNSKEAFRALKTLGKTVELVIYPREHHGINREPNHEIDKLERILAWLKRFR